MNQQPLILTEGEQIYLRGLIDNEQNDVKRAELAKFLNDCQQLKEYRDRDTGN